MDPLFLETPPPLDPEWVRYGEEAGLNKPKPVYASPLERQPVYAKECRELTAAMMASGARDHHLAQGVGMSNFTVPASDNGFPIPVFRWELLDPISEDALSDEQKKTVTLYIHGGGLMVGEADSEELSCRRILKDSGIPKHTVFSIGYRLLPKYTAHQGLSDCVDVFNFLRATAEESTKIVLVGSSSGGELAALVSQMVPRGSVFGVVLRCPVTSDAFSGMQYVPEKWRSLHTSASEPFWNSLLGRLEREVPRDGLERMPLEATEEQLRDLPKTWVQVCSNDSLYPDGVCYARALQQAGVKVKIDVVWGWPHTFWLKAPHLARALEADKALLGGLVSVAG